MQGVGCIARFFEYLWFCLFCFLNSRGFNKCATWTRGVTRGVALTRARAQARRPPRKGGSARETLSSPPSASWGRPSAVRHQNQAERWQRHTSGELAPRRETASPTSRWTSASSASTPPTARCAQGPCHAMRCPATIAPHSQPQLQPQPQLSPALTPALVLTRALAPHPRPRAAQVGRSQQGSEDALGYAAGRVHAHLIHVPDPWPQESRDRGQA